MAQSVGLGVVRAEFDPPDAWSVGVGAVKVAVAAAVVGDAVKLSVGLGLVSEAELIAVLSALGSAPSGLSPRVDAPMFMVYAYWPPVAVVPAALPGKKVVAAAPTSIRAFVTAL